MAAGQTRYIEIKYYLLTGYIATLQPNKRTWMTDSLNFNFFPRTFFSSDRAISAVGILTKAWREGQGQEVRSALTLFSGTAGGHVSEQRYVI